jgi:hypothetical protein
MSARSDTANTRRHSIIAGVTALLDALWSQADS